MNDAGESATFRKTLGDMSVFLSVLFLSHLLVLIFENDLLFLHLNMHPHTHHYKYKKHLQFGDYMNNRRVVCKIIDNNRFQRLCIFTVCVYRGISILYNTQVDQSQKRNKQIHNDSLQKKGIANNRRSTSSRERGCVKCCGRGQKSKLKCVNAKHTHTHVHTKHERKNGNRKNVVIYPMIRGGVHV